MGDHAFGRVEEGLSQAEGHALHAAFDDAAHRVAVGRRGMQHLVETFGVGAAADLGQPGREADACGQHLFGHDARGDQRHREARREVSAAARIVESGEFVVGHQVGVRGAVVAHDGRVVLRVGVGVGEFDGQRRARRVAVVDSRHDLRYVGFAPRRRAGRSAAASREVFGEVLL